MVKNDLSVVLPLRQLAALSSAVSWVASSETKPVEANCCANRHAASAKQMTPSTLQGMCPFFIVSDVARSIAFYQNILGFQTRYQHPPETPFFAIIGRDGAQLFIKAGEVAPMPNSTRDPAMRWDAYVSAFDPDSIAADFAARGATFSRALADTHDGLRGFEIEDPDGYVLFFGCPKDDAAIHRLGGTEITS